MTDNTEIPQDFDELETLFRAKELNYLLLMSRPNVIGVDIGYRVRAGETTDERVIKVYVSQKLDRRLLSDDQLVPATVQVDDHAVPVDVEQATIPQPCIFTLRSRPLRGGSSIGIDPVSVGTLGVCLTLDDANTYILSCNHVIAGTDTAPIGTNILQPGQGDGGNPATDVIARLSHVVPLDFGTTTVTVLGQTITVPNPNFVDASLGRVIGAYDVGNREIHWIGYSHLNLPAPWPLPFRLALPGMRVCKMGRTTEFTTGTITSATTDTFIGPYGGAGAGRNAFFKNQLRIQGDGGRPFAQSGDSGSIVMALGDAQSVGYPLGLLFAANSTDGFANPLDAVTAALSIPRI